MKNFILNTLIFLFIFTGVSLLGWSYIQEAVIEYLIQVEVEPEQFTENLMQVSEESFPTGEDVALLDWQGVLPYVNEEVFPTGELIIPSIDLQLPIFQGMTNAHLSLGAATNSPHQVMGEGNYVLASHALGVMDGLLFSALHRIEKGDLLVLRSADHLYVYETIIANEIIHETDSHILNEVEGKTLLTLFTCTPDVYETGNRILVRGELVERIPLAQLDNSPANLELEESTITANQFEQLAQTVTMTEREHVAFPFLEVASLLTVATACGVIVLLITNKKK